MEEEKNIISAARETLGGGGGGAGGGITPPFITTCTSSLIRSIKHGRDNSKGAGPIGVCGAGLGRMLINGRETERRSIKHEQSH